MPKVGLNPDIDSSVIPAYSLVFGRGTFEAFLLKA
jgi:hypothetical protein